MKRKLTAEELERKKAYEAMLKINAAEKRKAYLEEYYKPGGRGAHSKKEYEKRNKEKILAKAKERYAESKGQINEANRERYKNDPLFATKQNLRNRVRIAIKRGGWKKTAKTQEIVGADWLFVKEYIEKKWKEGMSWENYNFNGWHIDHIIPLDSAKTEEELIKLCHYTNLQPLWARENLSKGNRCVK
jgi:hypothetical protein